jgi:sugar lactone lactonase YvrE
VPLFVAACWVCAGAAAAQSLYWIDTNYGAPTINQANAAGNNVVSAALPAGSQPEGLALDASGRLFWAEAAWTGARVQRSSASLGLITTLVTGGSAMRGIAVDGTDLLMYWTSSNLVTGARIHRAALDGSGVTTLISLGPLANPRGIAVDHAGGKLYWADFNQDAIYRANLNGTTVEVWQTALRPYGVAFDPVGQYVYWTEYGGKIRRALASGSSPQTLTGGLAQPTYITLDVPGGQMYWAEAGAGAQVIARAPMTGGAKTVLPITPATYGGLAWQSNGSVAVPGTDLPTVLALAPVSPNPSHGSATIEFALPRDTHVRLSVLDLQGREVALLADADLPAGRHHRAWDDAASRPAPAGIYFVRMTAEGRTWVQRLVRVR